MHILRFCLYLLVVLTATSGCAVSPKSGQGFSDVAYGHHKRHVYDVYLPTQQLQDAPVIFMVHGGAWRAGDKTNRRVVKYKIQRWVDKGIVFISTNYRLLPDADPLQQAWDVAQAIAHAQHNAAQYGADPKKFVLMGHSAGAHIISLLNSDFSIAEARGARPWLGAVSIDTPAFNIEELMQQDPAWFYRVAFGEDPLFWRDASPFHRIQKSASPLLAIYSTKRGDNPLVQIEAFADKAKILGCEVEKLSVKYSHTQANGELGRENDYTLQVEAFLKRLDDRLKKRLWNEEVTN